MLCAAYQGPQSRRLNKDLNINAHWFHQGQVQRCIGICLHMKKSENENMQNYALNLVKNTTNMIFYGEIVQ